jgi:RND superfamily putative drug exporter
MKNIFADLGAWVARHRLLVVAIWLIAILAGAWTARQLPAVVIGGSGALSASPSQRMSEILRTEFDHPTVEPLVVALSSPRYRIEDPEFHDWIATAAGQLRALPEVRQVVDYAATGDMQLRSADGHCTLLLVALDATAAGDRERAVPLIRRALAEIKTKVMNADPAARMAVTGQAATTVDINEVNRSDGDRAEARALPLTLLILLLSFGALAAAGLPLAMGLAATTIALGLAWGLAQVLPVSNLLQNVVTMLGLALGIDYSLLMVSRFREALPARDVAAAIALVLGECGGTIAGSGLTVIVGLLGLLFSPLLETRSIGIGGALVVLVAVFAALTLLPALLALLGARVNWPEALSRHLSRGRTDVFWKKLAAAVVRRPLPVLIASTAAAALIALPGLYARSGFDNDRSAFPPSMESRIGADILAEMGNSNLTLPIYLVMRTGDGRPLLDSTHLAHLAAYVGRIAADARIAAIAPPLTPDEDPRAGLLSLSRDRNAGLLQIIADSRLDLAGVQALARDLEHSAEGIPFSLQVGGPPVYYNDYARFMRDSFARVFAFVVAATLVLLFIVFRSWLLPVKAVLTNLLAVAAGYGAVVAVFQFGWLASWIGVDHPHSAIPLVVPLLCFCLSFGLSMDYEVFLLRRIQANYAQSSDNAQATAEGLASTGPVITGAALIMAVVFGAFVGTDLALLKMIGLCLTVTVLIDATLIRCLIVPAAMCLAGRWNWLPGIRRNGVSATKALGNDMLH